MITLKEIITLIGAELYIPKMADDSRGTSADDLASTVISAIKPLDEAGSGEISFITNPRYFSQAKTSKAAAIITAKSTDEISLPQLVHPNPYAAMAVVSQHFYQPKHSRSGICEGAHVDPSASVDPSATIYPMAFVDKGAQIAAGCVIYPHSFIGENCKIGKNTVVEPNCSILFDCLVGENCIIHAGSVIGGDGFGFAPTGTKLEKIPQIGKVVIGNNVEMGPLANVDRGAYKDTVVGDGCKLDTMVHLAHGVKLGKNSMICGQCEIAGSTETGENLVMAGQSAIGPSLKVGSNIILGPKAGLNNSYDKPGEYMDMPISPIKEWRRQAVAKRKLPEMLSRIQKLERELEKLTKN